MYEIVKKELLAPNIVRMEIRAPRTAKSCLPGQFVIVKADEQGERIPLTICDYSREAKTVTIVFQTVGTSTKLLAEYEEGEAFFDFVGPLGCSSDLLSEPQEDLKAKKLLFIAGGVGTAPVYPQVKWLHEHGILADCIIGARNQELIILEQEMKEVAGEVFVCTDDGSLGLKGNVNDCLKYLISEKGKQYDHIIAIGPLIMMKFVCLLTKELGIKTTVSMNPIMVDGTGMCGACRLTVGGETKFACVDGPEFDGHLVDFEEAMRRQQLYRTEEGRAVLREKEGSTHHGGCGYCEET